MELEDNTKAVLIVGLICLLFGIILGTIISYSTQETCPICKTCPSPAETKIGKIEACHQGCYNALFLALEEGETVEDAFPVSFHDCKAFCMNQYLNG